MPTPSDRKGCLFKLSSNARAALVELAAQQKTTKTGVLEWLILGAADIRNAIASATVTRVSAASGALDYPAGDKIKVRRGKGKGASLKVEPATYRALGTPREPILKPSGKL